MTKLRMVVMLVVIAAGGFSVTGCGGSPVALDDSTAQPDPNNVPG